MEIAIMIAGWLAGLFLSIQVIAAWFAIIDYRYRMRRYRRRVASRIVIWTLLYLFARWLAGPAATYMDSAFLFMLVAYAIALLMAPALMVLVRHNIRSKYAAFLKSTK